MVLILSVVWGPILQILALEPLVLLNLPAGSYETEEIFDWESRNGSLIYSEHDETILKCAARVFQLCVRLSFFCQMLFELYH